MTKKNTTSKKPKGKKKKAKPKAKAKRKKQPPLTNAMVKAWAFKCENLTDAAVNYKGGNLPSRLDRSAKLLAAWKRGRFLRRISELARAGSTKAEVAIDTGIDLPGFEELLAETEAADIWISAQNAGKLDIRLGIKSNAIAGKLSAVKSLERIFDNEKPAGAVLDIFKVTTRQLVAIADVSRQTIQKWQSNGLTRAGDDTFDLRQAWQWFGRWSQRKVNVTPQVSGPDALRDLKAKQLADKIDEDRGKLVPRDAVITGYVGRLQWDNEFYDRNIESVCQKCGNMPPAGVREILDKFQDQRRGELAKADIEMKLTADQEKRLASFLKELE